MEANISMMRKSLDSFHSFTDAVIPRQTKVELENKLGSGGC